MPSMQTKESLGNVYIAPQNVVGGIFGFRSDANPAFSLIGGSTNALPAAASTESSLPVSQSSAWVFTHITAVEPLIEGSTIPIYRVSALLDGGQTIEQILEDFPSLSRAQVESAYGYALGNPISHNPYPKKSFKRLLRNAGFYQALKRTRKAI